MRGTALLCMFAISHSAMSQEKHSHRWNLHFQTTYIYQYKPPFHSPYSGANSLTGLQEKQNSLTATVYAGVNLWKGGRFYVNPELAGGSGLSGALGMGGSSNGETFRVGNPAPTLYMGRAYLEQTFALGSETEVIEEGANELGGVRATRFLQLRVGKLSLGDLFDNNMHSNSPRRQFMNWALMNNGAWDYAANVRGYTYAFAADLELKGLGLRAAMAALPKTANGAELSTKISESYAINLEASKRFLVHGRAASFRLLYFVNTAPMGNYAKSIQLAGNGEPDITATRVARRTKHGLGLNYDQRLSKHSGLFARAGWNDGRNETWCFTEIDRTLTGGLLLDGERWKRKGDNAGIALLTNSISRDHRRYLSKGGYGFIVGDGRLNYAPEYAAEVFYSFRPLDEEFYVSADYQFMVNPGYNTDRGPVHIFSVRVHVEL